MSAMIEYNNKLLTFDEYCILSEALNPKPTKYGNNNPHFDNQQYTTKGNTQTTWFLDGSILYWVWFDELSEVSFMKYTNKDLQAFSDTDWYVMGKSTPTNAIRIFSSIFYIALTMSEQFHRNYIYFKGFSTQLDKFYKYLGQNKQFLASIASFGWYYNGENEELKHEFVKGIK
jgi:hypothetical protein